ncbi:MAG TPA: hypothetical protein VFA63_09495 [Pseudonocardiaceae bacterium]|nr:hypothetical protein [Pseudonocardiaceae bacterium]
MAASLHPAGRLGGELSEAGACWLAEVNGAQGAQCRVGEGTDPAVHVCYRTDVDQQLANLDGGVLVEPAVANRLRNTSAAPLWCLSSGARNP